MEQSWEPFGSARRLSEEAERPRRSAEAVAAAAAAAKRSAGAAGRGEGRGGAGAARPLSRTPAAKLVIVTCMDTRVDPLAALGLSLGDANVIRNAGATISDDVLRSLRLSQSVLGTRRALLIGHTDCAGFESDAAAEASLRDGLRRIRGSSAVPDSFGLEALMYDVRTGALSPLS